MGKVKELHEQIREAAEHYYKGHSILTDSEFDKLLDNLKEARPDHPILKAVGFGYMPEPGESKVSHIGDTVGSLDKIKIDDISPTNYNSGMDKLHTTVSMPKLDGGSLVAHYERGLLQRVLTRGNGEEGIDVTKNMYDNLPQKIENHDIRFMAIRGEAVITYDDFEGMEGSNPRNKCAGIIQSKSGHEEDLKKVKFIPYAIVATSREVPPSIYKFLTDKKAQLDFFKKNGFEAIPYEITEWKNTYDKFLNVKYLPLYMMKTSDNKTLPVDGLVMSREYIDHKKSNDGMFYYYYSESIAFKYDDETVRTTVEDISWNMSMGSKFVPVLKIKEIEIDGVKINNVTANNYKWLTDRKCGIGAEIEVKRANEVIPNMHMVITESENYNLPPNNECYACGENLSVVGTDLMCVNDDCPQIIYAIIYKIWNFIKPDGASDACFDIFFNDYVMYYDEDIKVNLLYLLKHRGTRDFDRKYTNHYHKLVQKAIDNFKDVVIDLPDLIKMANIPTLGSRIGKRIKETISLDKFVDCIINGKTFSPSVFKYSVLNEKHNRKKLEFVCEIWDDNLIINQQEEVKKMREFKVALTGSVSLPRSKWFKEMAKYGVEKVSVSKNCDYLICNGESSSSSYKKAKDLDIPILTEEAFMEILNNENV